MPGIYNLHINATTLRATRSPRGEGLGGGSERFIVLFVLVSAWFGSLWLVRCGGVAGAMGQGLQLAAGEHK